MKLFNTTKRWVDWWKKRKIDWKAHYMNPQHPHRALIAEVLKHLQWKSLIEVGCGAGANLVHIVKTNEGKQVGGVDINPDAIAFARTQFSNALLKVNPADNILLSDQSVDVILSDMTMIYISPFKMKKHLKEFKRLARNYLVLCELHSPSLWERFAVKWKQGYNVYNWPKLLEKHGFNDIQAYKIPKECWPESDLQQQYGYIIVARTPKYY
jgi:ubiquinone/menaquinone biosynthesis C-methylase UbiE